MKNFRKTSFYFLIALFSFSCIHNTDKPSIEGSCEKRLIDNTLFFSVNKYDLNNLDSTSILYLDHDGIKVDSSKAYMKLFYLENKLRAKLLSSEKLLYVTINYMKFDLEYVENPFNGLMRIDTIIEGKFSRHTNK